MSEMQAYCVKCKTKRDMVETEAVYTKTGSPATRGKCAVCGTNLFRMGETAAHADMPRPEATEKPARTPKASQSKSKSKKKKSSIGKLVIVESPAKARSVGGYLGSDYTVMASKGHVRDLLVTQLSVDIDNNFEPRYRVPNDKRETVKELRTAAENADEIFLATDPDREGEAIAWHLISAADMPEKQTRRVVFNEITKPAVQEAFQHPRDVDMNLVNAQQARRILDRLVGYNITELLWSKVRNRLSAGRVQSIALRMVVDREREIEAFNAVEYWSIEAELSKQGSNGARNQSFVAKLAKINGEDIALSSESEVQPHVDTLEKSRYSVQDVKIGTRKRRPSPPFTTSTLQQEASKRFGWAARRTMRVAQQLYEGVELGQREVSGLITYMRTDSVQVSQQAQTEARAYITGTYGQDFVPATPPQYKTKSKGAQEAHEAIRPTDVLRNPNNLSDALSRDQYRLYKLIWERFVASQMSNAIYDTIRVEIAAGPTEASMPYLFRSSGSKIKFAGFLALYEDTRDEDVTSDEDAEITMPELSADELLNLLGLAPEQHFTQPPPRYTEATLVRTLEEYGIGRPSTYAPTVAVIQDRDYVTKDGKRLVPTETGKVVSELLVKYFPDEMDYQFTARMEEQLDEIADGEGVWQPMLQDFYSPFEQRLENARKNMPQMQQEEHIGRQCPACENGDLVIKYGRWGKFIGCSNYPDCRHTEPYLEKTGLICPQCGEEHQGEIVVRKSRRGRTFFGCSRYPDCDYSTWNLPKTGDDDEQQESEAVADASGH